MRIRSVELAAIVSRPEAGYPDDLPQVAIAGRSNVGKSSLLNTLAGRRHLAPVSSTPGRTRAIHFYRTNGRFYLVDLPGYGYAKVAGVVRRGWRPLIEGYLTAARRLSGAILLLDARHRPSEDDRLMAAYLGQLGIPTLFVLTKIDKLRRFERARRTAEALAELEAPASQAVWFSAKTSEGKVWLLKQLGDLLRTAQVHPGASS